MASSITRKHGRNLEAIEKNAISLQKTIRQVARQTSTSTGWRICASSQRIEYNRECKHELTLKAEKFPLRVTNVTAHHSHVCGDRHNHDGMVSRDRIEVFPRHDFGQDFIIPPVKTPLNRDKYEYFLEEIIGHEVKEKNPKECSNVLCKWYGFKSNTYEPLANVRRSQIWKIFNQKGLPSL